MLSLTGHRNATGQLFNPSFFLASVHRHRVALNILPRGKPAYRRQGADKIFLTLGLTLPQLTAVERLLRFSAVVVLF